MRYAALLAALVLALTSGHHVSAKGPAPFERWTCSLEATDSIAVCSTGIADTDRVRYVTDVIAQSNDTSAGLVSMRTGSPDPLILESGGPCGLSTRGFLFAAVVNSMLVAAPNNTRPTVLTLANPLRVPPGRDLCVVADPASSVTVLGYIAP